MPLFGGKKGNRPSGSGPRPSGIELPDMPATELRAAIDHIVNGTPMPKGRGPEVALLVANHLLDILGHPEQWPALKPEERLALLQAALFSFALDRRWGRYEFIRTVFGGLLPLMTEAERMRAVKSTLPALRACPDGPDELAPFLFWEAYPSVISTAALETSLLTSLERDDPMTGVRTLLGFALDSTRDAVGSGAVIGSLVIHGDRRVPPVIFQTWRALSPDAQRIVALGVHPGLILTGTVEYYLQWLEDDRAKHPELPAQALARLPVIARHDGKVREMERRLPADYRSTPAQDRRNPQLRTIKEWSIRDYGRHIEPRLKRVLKRTPAQQEVKAAILAWR